MLVDADSDGVNRIETQIINLNDDCFFEIFKYIPCIRKKILLRRGKMFTMIVVLIQLINSAFC